MLKKLIASGSAAVLALTTIAQGVVYGAPAVTDPELIDAVSWAYDAGLTKFADADAFMPFNNLTREQFAKFASEFASSQLDVEADDTMDCSFSDESSFDSSLASAIEMACQQGLMKGSNGKFMAKQLVTRGQVATVVSRMLGEIDPMSSEQEHFEYLRSQAIMNVANLGSAVTRGDALLILYRLANGSDSDLCTIDPTLPGCDDSTDPTDPVVVKEGDLNVSLNPSSPANMSSIPNNGVSRFATVDFTAGSKDVTLNTVALKRSGLGTYTDFGNGGRLYFEINGVRVSSRATVSSDDTTVLSFTPALVVAAGKTVSVDLMAELVAAPTGTENEFMSTMIDSSAATVNGMIDTPVLRTAAYSVRSVTFTNQNVLTTYQGNEETVELGKFQLQNIGDNTINVNVQAITFRNVGNGDVTQGLSDLKLLRAGNAVSSSVIVNGRDVTFVLADSITDGQTASYTIQAKVADVENASGDTYKFILRQSTDLNAKEANTGFRSAVTITANAANDTTTANQYTVNGGELRFVRDTSLTLSQNVTPGALQVEFMKGTIEAKQAILLEDVVIAVSAGSATIDDAFKKVYLQIGSSVFTWTPDAVTPANNATAEFDGSVTVNGTVPVRMYADVYTNAPVNGPYTFASLDGSVFTRKEYVSNQNNVGSSIGNIASSALSVVTSTLSVTKFDSLGTIVYSTNNAQGKAFYGVRLSNNQNNPIKVGSITLTPSNVAMNNGISVTLKQGSTSLSTKTLNGATTFNGLNIVINKDQPVDLTFEGNFLSTIAPSTNGTFSVSFNAGDVIDNVTSNNVTVNGTPATSATLSVIGGGTAVINSSSSVPAQSFMTAGETKKVGTINIQAVNDELEVRGLYLRIEGQGGFAANAGNQISNVQLKDSLGNIVASESSRDTQTNANDIVKFNSFVAGTIIAPGSSKSFDVYATVNSVNNSASAGEFRVTLASSYNDSSYTDEFQGTRLYSVNAGSYVSAGTFGGVSNPTAQQNTTVTVSNLYYVVAAYPKLQGVDLVGNNTRLIEFTITNPSSTNTLRATGFAYTANATTLADITGKVADVFVNNAPQTATIAVATAGTFNFDSALEIAPGASVTVRVELQTAYIASPASGTRTRSFTIENVGFTQVFSDASTQTIGSIALGYQASAGLKLQATYSN
jgi:hypothetical protein